MAAKISKRNKKYLILLILIVLLIALSGILSPVIVEKEKNSWNETLIDRVDYTCNAISQTFDSKSSTLLRTLHHIKKRIESGDNESKGSKPDLLSLLNSDELKNYLIQIYDDRDSLFAWNSQPVLEKNDFIKIRSLKGQTFFQSRKAITYIVLPDTIKISGRFFLLVISLPVEKRYSLSRKVYRTENLTDSLSSALLTKIEINYSDTAPLSKDGKRYSFPVLNNYKNKIGVATFDKPSLDTELFLIQKKVTLIQYSLTLLIIVLSGIWFRVRVKKIEKRRYRFISIALFLVLLRILLFAFEIPSFFVHNSLSDPANFSSVFAFGMVRSPLEFLVTVLFLIILVFTGYKYTREYFTERESNQENSKIKIVLASIAILFLYLLSLRGLSAAIRSVIFDSTIRYFKDFALIPSPPIFLMNINLLALGFSSLLFSMTLLLLWLSLFNTEERKKSYRIIAIIFAVLQLSGWVFDSIQSEPQGTPLIRIIYILITCVLLLFISSKKRIKEFVFVYYAFAASIISVALLTYYNSRIERESLKTTAQELTRTNEDLVEFMVFQTLVRIQQDNGVVNSFYQSENLSADAFVLWTGSLLYNEGIPSAINFFDSSKNFVGGYQTGKIVPFGSVFEKLNDMPDSLKIFRETDLYGERTNFTGIVPVIENDTTIGYAVVSAVYDENYLNDSGLPKIFSRQRSGISSALDFAKLKIFDFQNGQLIHSYGGTFLSTELLEQILKTEFSSYSEAWLNLEINGENHLCYLYKFNQQAKEKILAVAVEEKNFSWNLSDFFKVFFLHTIIIVLLIIASASARYKNTLAIFASYRTKLVAAFMFISLIPLIIIAFYFRDLTEKKNAQLVEKRLTEMTEQIEFYLNLYETGTTIDHEVLFEKTARDLNLNFSAFDGMNLIYSSQVIYNEVGLLPSIPNPVAYTNCTLQKEKRGLYREDTDGVPVNVVYASLSFGGKSIILRVDDLFNKVSVPLSDVELDIFLFGIFSLVVLLLFIFSSLLAAQISSPIRKLTLATKSVGSGDLNVEVNYKTTGEIRELVDGFNRMVKKIEQSQYEIAKMERESAWKEMAKQVAHEIKNPLTPMKLNVQQLIAAYNDKSEKFDQIFGKVTSTLISQIDTLKNIASEFSNFARMPRLNIEKLNAVSVIKDSLNLFTDEKKNILFSSSIENIYLLADNDQLKRTIINMIRNSIQAEAKKIFISVSSSEGFCQILIEDNGTGINPENISKVFDENFTTKKRGMGIGLSMAKKFINSLGGEISIERSDESGTVFLIKIPLAENE